MTSRCLFITSSYSSVRLRLLEIVLLDAFLRLLDGTVQQRMLQFLAFFQAHFLHHFHDAVRAEQAASNRLPAK